MRDRTVGALLLSPALAVVGLFVVAPLAATLVLSTLRWDLTSGPPDFVGLANYAEVLARPETARSLLVTVALAVGVLPFATVIPLGLAVALWKRPGRASGVYRAVLFLPMVLAPVATAVSWQFVLNPLQGVATTALGAVGAGPVDWFGGPATALVALTLITGARATALSVLLFGAALDRVDRTTLAAARLDGATEGEVTRHVLLPHVARTAALLGGITAVLAGQWAFTSIAVLTQGGPDGWTTTVYYWIYDLGFTFFDVGQSCAAAVLLVVLLVAPFGVRALWARARASRWARASAGAT